MSFTELPRDDYDLPGGGGVRCFEDVNATIWRLPTTTNREVDWTGLLASLEPSAEEQSSLFSRCFLNWLSPYITLARRERLEEASMPPPQRPHRAVYCGALLSRAFREEEVRAGRDAWRARVEATAEAGGAAAVVRPNALAGVQFGGEAGVRGRLRWVGYLRSSDAPHELLGGVEWDEGSALPAYRQRHVEAGEAEAVHDGVVHGERLFHPARRGRAHCTCEYVADLVPLDAASGEPVRSAPPPPRAPSLLRALFRTFRGDVLALVAPAVGGMVCELATPALLQQFVLFLQSDKTATGLRKGIAMFVAFSAVILAKPLVFNKQMQRGRRISSLFRAATLGVIFEKCLTVAPDAMAHPEMSTGRILTMASADIENIKEFPSQVMYLWIAPVMIVCYLVYLYTLVDWCMFCGVGVFAVSLPLQTVLSKRVGRKQQSLSSCTDQRLRRTNELLSGIRVVKTMGWESKFLTAVEDESRRAELGHRRSLQTHYIVLWSCLFSTPPFMIASMLTAYTLSGHVMDASVVLPVIAVVSAVTFPIMMLPEAFASLAKFIVSTGRITQFLECDDSHITVEDAAAVFGDGAPAAGACLEQATVLASVPAALPAYEPRHSGLRHTLERVRGAVLRGHAPVELQWRRSASVPPAPAATAAAAGTAPGGEAEAEAGGDGAALYALEDKALLRDVTVAFPRGQLTVVVGATGSGKSVLLSTLLGAFRFRGRAGVAPSIAYVPQQPWIMQETVRANITFFEGDQRGTASGGSGDAVAWSPLRTAGGGVSAVRAGCGGDRLGDAVRCCQLEADLSLLSKGLETEIGEKGVNLSGGQKARVSLARAVYADRDVYVLDDPLSALDAHVGRRVMEDVVLRALAGKTRVLVTHQLHVLPYADQVVVVRDGCVVFAGSHGAYAESEWRSYVEHEEEQAGTVSSHTKRATPHGVEEEEDEYNDYSPMASPLLSKPSPFSSKVSNSREAGTQPKEMALPTFGDRHGDTLSRSTASEHSKHSRIMSRRAAAMSSSITTEGDDEDEEWCSGETREASRLRRRCSRSARVVAESSPGDPAAGERNAPEQTSACQAPSQQFPLSLPATASPAAAELADVPSDDEDVAEAAPLVSREEKESGTIPWSIYRRYCSCGGGVAAAVIIIALYLLAEVVVTATSVWLTLWSVQHFAGVLSSNQQLGIYVGLVVGLQVLKVVCDTTLFFFVRRAASRLHALLLYTVCSARVSFFDRTPLGRIINRFSKDIYTLDDELPSSLIPLFQIAGYLLTSLSVMMYTSPFTSVGVVICGCVFSRLLTFYTTVVREVRRRGSVVQSPLFSLLEEVVQGRATIAAYGKSHALFCEALRRLDLVYSCTYAEKAVTLWLSIRIEYIAAALIIVVGLIGVVEKVVDASAVMAESRVGLISLSLTMCLDLSWSLSMVIELAAVVEASMNSVQRVWHYIEGVPQEALLLAPRDAYVAAALAERGGGGGAGVPPAARARDVVVLGGGAAGADGGARRGDAAFGSLELEHVDMRYRPGLPLVLRDVSFAVAPGQKVGVVGRTGSGKSTLLLALLRLVEVCGGRMRVCGRDAQAYTLPALRRLFSMIPQDPVLFDGTVRSNVDPFGDATDAEVRHALASVGFVSGDDGEGEVPALETVVQEGGSNFSVGQRQLLCLARALLKKGSAFILMDEATANVDARLDQTVQRVVAEQFRDYTVVTIAHRLHTVASYDMILVMAHGRVVECGSPRSLLERRTSVFYGMVAQSSAVAAAVGPGGGGGGEGEGGAVSAEERARRVEEVVASFMQGCK